jgi:hypothetical protein
MGLASAKEASSGRRRGAVLDGAQVGGADQRARKRREVGCRRHERTDRRSEGRRAEGAGAAGWDVARSRCYRRHLAHLFSSRISIGELQGAAHLREKYRRTISPARAPPSCCPARFHLCAQLPFVFFPRVHRSARTSHCARSCFLLLRRLSNALVMPLRVRQCHMQEGHSGHDTSIRKLPRRLGDD